MTTCKNMRTLFIPLFKINNLNSKKIEYYIFIEILGSNMAYEVKTPRSDGFKK